jgi:hypothetical protein
VQENYDDGFDVDEYISNDREDEIRRNNIDNSMAINPEDRIDMASFMDGTVSTENL